MGCFKHLHIACTGTLKAKPEELKRWVENNDGWWMPKVGKGITHLIASKEAWKKGTKEVRTAAQLGAKIVTYDWLEDSSQGKRKLAERKYLWSTIDKEKKKARRQKKVGGKYDRTKFAREIQQAGQDLGTSESSPSSSSRRSRNRSVAGGGFFLSSLSALRAERERRERQDHPEDQGVVEEERVGEWKKVEDYDNDGEMGDADKEEMEVDDVDPKGDEEMEENGEAEDEDAVERDVNEDTDMETTSDADEKAANDNHPPTREKKATPPSSPAPPSTPTWKEPVFRNTLPTPPHSTTSSQSQSQIQTSPPPPPQPAVPAPPKAERLIDTHHIHLDRSGFSYNLTLLRQNFSRNTITKYHIRLYESHTLPHTYATFVRYRPAETTPAAIPPGQAAGAPTTGAPSTASPPASTQRHPSLLAALSAIAAPPPPSPDTPPPSHLPYRALLAPIGSDYANAFSAFKSAFRELTLLSWEERCAPDWKLVQKERARTTRREPFMWVRPTLGLSVGVEGPAGEEGRVFGLPGMDGGLDREGVFGGEILREEERGREWRDEQEREREREREAKKGKGKGKGKGKKGVEGVKGTGGTQAVGTQDGKEVDPGRARIYRGPVGGSGMGRFYKNYSMGDGRL